MGGLRLPLLGVVIPERNLDAGEQELAKRSILELYDDFTSRVAKARGLEIERVREIAEGRVYMGRTALDLKLVDRVASLDETIEAARTAAGVRKGTRVRIEEYPRLKLFKLPGLFPSIVSRAAESVIRASRDATDAEPEPWTYEQRSLGLILSNPATPLLLTPSSLLPDEPAAH